MLGLPRVLVRYLVVMLLMSCLTSRNMPVRIVSWVALVTFLFMTWVKFNGGSALD